MTYIISSIITIFLILSLFGFAIMFAEDFDFEDLKETSWLEKIPIISAWVLLIIICILILIGIICLVRWLLLSIPPIKEFVTRMEWK